MPKELPRSPDDTPQDPDHSLDSVIPPRLNPTPEEGINLPHGFTDAKEETWLEDALKDQAPKEEPNPKKVSRSGVTIRIPKPLFSGKAKSPEPSEHAAKSPPYIFKPEPELVPAETATPEVFEQKSFNEVLVLQKEAFSARKEMIAFRHGKKVADLSLEDQERYKELKKISQEKRVVWLVELDKLPEDQQIELNNLKRFEQVKIKLGELPTERIVAEALKKASTETTKELEALDAEIAKFEKLVKFDKEIQPNTPSLYADRNIADLEELKKRRRALLAKKNRLEPKPEPEPEVPPVQPLPPEVPPVVPPVPPLETPSTPEEEPDEPLSNEQLQAEAKARRIEFYRAAINAIDKKILEKVDESSKTKTWNAWRRLRIDIEIEALRKDRTRLDREMNERVGFGTKFKEMATKAYRAVKNKLKFERSRPIGIGDLRGGPEPVSPIGESTGPEIEEETIESVDTKGSWYKWVKQRLGGQIGAGIPEVWTAEKMRKGTKSVGQETSALANIIESESNLSLGEAEDEAIIIKKEMAAKGIETVMDDRILGISAEITAEKVAENDARIDQIVIMDIDKLEKNLNGYKKDFGQEVLTEENKSKIATEIRAQLVGLRSGQAGADVRDLIKMLRGNLDETWKRRYLYGAVEAVLAGMAIHWAWGKIFGAKAKEILVSKGGGQVGREAVDAYLKDTIWAEAQRDLVAAGIKNPTPFQILKVTTKYCVDSGVKVMANGKVIWLATKAGTAVDTALKNTFLIHKAGGLKLIAGMVTGA